MSNPSPTAAATEAATPATLADLIRAAGDEFAATGDLSEVSYAALTDAGIPRATIDAHIDGLLLRIELSARQVYAAAGGEEQLAAMNQWAVTNLSNGEVAEIAAAFASGDMTATLSQVETLRNRYVSANNAGAI